MAIDWDFIRQLEGFITEANVPTNEDGSPAPKAGVTIGSGIDLGSKTEASLKNLGVPQRIVAQVKDYLKLKGQKAVDKLAAEPLNMSEEDVTTLTQLVKQDTAKKVKSWYNKNNSANNDWSDLTDRQQTTITSVHFQYGPGNKNATPTFNKHVLSNNWAKTIDELRNFGDDFSNRRHKELQYLVDTKVDGAIGPNTEEAVSNYINSAEMRTRQKGLVTEQPIPSTGMDPNTFAMVPQQTDTAQRALESTANPVAAQESSDDFLTRLYEGLDKVLNVPQRRSQEPTEAVTAAEPAPEPKVQEDDGLTDFERELLNEPAPEQRPGQREEEAMTEEDEDDGITDFERGLIQSARGTVETEDPVYAETSGEIDDNKDPTFGIF